MQQIHPENWITLYFGLVFMIACAQMIVAYAISGSNNLHPGLVFIPSISWLLYWA